MSLRALRGGGRSHLQRTYIHTCIHTYKWCRWYISPTPPLGTSAGIFPCTGTSQGPILANVKEETFIFYHELVRCTASLHTHSHIHIWLFGGSLAYRRASKPSTGTNLARVPARSILAISRGQGGVSQGALLAVTAITWCINEPQGATRWVSTTSPDAPSPIPKPGLAAVAASPCVPIYSRLHLLLLFPLDLNILQCSLQMFMSIHPYVHNKSKPPLRHIAHTAHYFSSLQVGVALDIE